MIEWRRLNKVIATLWPSIYKKWILKQIDKFVDIYRINLSHADLFKTRQIIKDIKSINSKKIFMLDTKWPEIRTTNKEEINVEKWDIIKVYAQPKENNVSFEYELFENIPTDIEISFNDKAVVGIIKENNNDHLVIEIIQWWIIWYNKTINFIGYEPELDFLTEKDKEDIKFLVEENIWLLAVSFIKSHKDIIRLREYIKENYDYNWKIIAKIETASAVKDIDNIIQEADGIMIARWDLWASLDIKLLPRIQKEIIKKCNLVWKPVILATQVMASMTNKPLPTRAEVDEIAYNIQIWVDALMLSDETAIWKFPVETLSILNDIILEYQQDVKNLKFPWEEVKKYVKEKNTITDYIIYTAKKVASKVGAKFIVTPTMTWYTPGKLSWFKPSIPIIAFTEDENVFKYCNLMFGVQPHKVWEKQSTYDNLKKVIWEMLQLEFRWKIKWEDKIVIVHSTVWEHIPNMINGIEVIKFKDL
jgi:pyruvate kinase